MSAAAPPSSAGARPVIVAGMHRSGTSLVGSMLASVGVDMGERQLAADPHNPRGYFEDLDFLTLQRQMLLAATPKDDGGHRDWGWTESERLDETAFAAFAEQAAALVAARAGGSRAWGWKDPRTTVLLDFWQPLLPDAVYVLVYRHPWLVADSMQRLGADVFLRHPDYAYRIWRFYNRRLLAFRRAHRERSLLVSVDALGRDPSRLAVLLGSKLGIAGQVDGAAQRYEDELLRSLPPDDPLVSLAAATHVPCAELLRELDEEADLSGADTWRARPPAAHHSPAPRLSVVVPCYDQGELLVEAVASVERSVPEPYELIVVDDGSREPRTREILATLARGGYRVITQENRGLAGARNRGIEEAAAPYVLPLDADNRLRPGFVDAALRLLDEQPRVGVVYGDRMELGLRNGRAYVPAFHLPTLLGGNFIDACALLRREVWRAHGGFDGAMPHPGWEDWDLWLGTAARGWSFEHLPVEAFDYRVRPGSMITAFEDEALRRRVLAYLVAKHRDLFHAHLDELLFVAQSSSREIWLLSRRGEAAQRVLQDLRAEKEEGGRALERSSREHERLRAALEAETAARADLSLLWADAQRDRTALREERAGLYAERAALHAERAALEAERAALHRELAAWQERVAAMEGTLAWRLRRWLLERLRHRPGRKRLDDR